MKEPYKVVVNEAAIVREDSSRAEYVISQIIKTYAKGEESQFELSEYLAEFLDGDYQKADHTETLKEFLIKHQINISPREAQRRAEVSRKAKKLGITNAQLAKAGQNKAYEVFKLNPEVVIDHGNGVTEATSDIIKQLIADAPNWTVKQLHTEVKKIQGIADEEDDDNIVTKKVQWTSEQFSTNVERAVKLVQMQGNMQDEDAFSSAVLGFIIERLAVAYLQDVNNLEDLKKIEGMGGEFNDEVGGE